MSKIDVASYLNKKYESLALTVEELPIKPKLATILVGDRADSAVYVRNKEKSIDKSNALSETFRFEDGTAFSDLGLFILQLNNREDIHGILLQLPLNREFYSKEEEDCLINMIDYKKDVDGLNYINQSSLFMGRDQSTFLTPCTPTGITNLLKEQYNTLVGLDVTVIGRSQLLGNSLAQMLMRENTNVTMLHSKSGWNMEDYLAMNSVDILCLCAGSANLLTADDLNAEQDYTIIDAAINVNEDGKLRGDFKKEDYPLLDEWTTGYEVNYTSVPGGVGPLTTYTLAYNLYKAYCLQNGIELKSI